MLTISSYNDHIFNNFNGNNNNSSNNITDNTCSNINK